MDRYNQLLERVYNEALNRFTEADSTFLQPLHFTDEDSAALTYITDNVDNSKAVYTVIIASLVYKMVHPEQDVRYHQASLPNGYSGRSFDTRYITPFLKSKKIPHMAESGWLTRSLEQNYPYDRSYNGQIRDPELRKSFLQIMDSIQNGTTNLEHYLLYMLEKGIFTQKAKDVEIERNQNTRFSINEIMSMLNTHFTQSDSVGTARLPVLAVYSVYQCITAQLGRYNNKKLKEMASHTTSDLRSGDIGDVQVNNDDGTEFEGIEVKYGIKITPQLMLDSYEKFRNKQSVERYYILSTVEPTELERLALQSVSETIFEEHGAQFIANGLLNTIKYYLRLIDNTDQFLDYYTDNIRNDSVIKVEHKNLWKQIIENK